MKLLFNYLSQVRISQLSDRSPTLTTCLLTIKLEVWARTFKSTRSTRLTDPGLLSVNLMSQRRASRHHGGELKPVSSCVTEPRRTTVAIAIDGRCYRHRWKNQILLPQKSVRVEAVSGWRWSWQFCLISGKSFFKPQSNQTLTGALSPSSFILAQEALHGPWRS